MAIRSGFFNSVNGDRKYDAKRFAEYFASFIGNGVFPNPSDNLQVIANNNMTVTVRPGKAWINGYILINDDDYILTLDPADGALNRIDRIVARYDTVDREIRLEVKKGTFASSPVAPTLQRDADAYELALADVYVAAGSISISQADITDLRLNSELCGIVHGTVEQVDTTTLFNQYLTWLQEKKNQYDNDMINWTSQKQAEFEDWATAQEQDFENWRMQEEQNFNDWFHSIQDILDENAATTILNTIGDLETLTTTDKSSLVNAINEVDAKEVDLTPIEDQIADLEDDFESHKNEKATQSDYGHIRLADVPSPTIATQAEAETGTNNTKFMTPLRTHQAIDSKVRIVDNMLELNVDGEWQIFKLVPPDDTTDAPGSKWLIGGNMQAGFFGEVPASELITGDALASRIGLSSGTAQFSNEPWLKFAYQGKIQFVAKKPFRYSLSWNDINAANAVYGDRTVTIGGLTYKVRLMRGAENDPSNYTDDDRDAIGSEWNRLLLPIHKNASSNWTYPEYGGVTEDWGIDYTDADLLTHYNHGNGAYSWCQETQGDNASGRVCRGELGVSYSGSSCASDSFSYCGWRPVLELL